MTGDGLIKHVYQRKDQMRGMYQCNRGEGGPMGDRGTG